MRGYYSKAWPFISLDVDPGQIEDLTLKVRRLEQYEPIVRELEGIGPEGITALIELVKEKWLRKRLEPSRTTWR